LELPVVVAYESDKSEIAALLPASFKRERPDVLNAFLKAAIGKKDKQQLKNCSLPA
jgi:hypothetical protein